MRGTNTDKTARISAARATQLAGELLRAEAEENRLIEEARRRLTEREGSRLYTDDEVHAEIERLYVQRLVWYLDSADADPTVLRRIHDIVEGELRDRFGDAEYPILQIKRMAEEVAAREGLDSDDIAFHIHDFIWQPRLHPRQAHPKSEQGGSHQHPSCNR
jgi:hypothetical protein